MQSCRINRRVGEVIGLLLVTVWCWGADTGSDAELPAGIEPTITEVMEDAFQGDAVSQLKLGLMYEQRNSFTNAVRWYRKAAEQGNADAQFKIGYLHTTGQGMPRDHDAAAKWFRLAAEQNVLAAQYDLAVCLEKGYGGPTNNVEALKWYHKAAGRGDEFAQKAVGVFYEKGKGVPVDMAEAYKWYQLAAARGNPDAIKLLDLLRPRLTPQQLAEGRRRYAASAASIPGSNLILDSSVPPKPRSKPKDFLE